MKFDYDDVAPPLPPKLTTFGHIQQSPHHIHRSPSTTPLPASPSREEENPLLEQCHRMMDEDKDAEEKSLLAHEDEFSDDDDQEPIPPPRFDALEAKMEEDLEGGGVYDDEVCIIDNRMPSPILKVMLTPPVSNPSTTANTPIQEYIPREIVNASPKCVRFNMEPEITRFEVDSPDSQDGDHHLERGGNSYEELVGLKVERRRDDEEQEPSQVSISVFGCKEEEEVDIDAEDDLLYLADAGCQTECEAQEVEEHYQHDGPLETLMDYQEETPVHIPHIPPPPSSSAPAPIATVSQEKPTGWLCYNH